MIYYKYEHHGIDAIIDSNEYYHLGIDDVDDDLNHLKGCGFDGKKGIKRPYYKVVILINKMVIASWDRCDS